MAKQPKKPNDSDLKLDSPEPAGKGGGKKKLILLLLIGIVLLVLIGAAVYFFVLKGSDQPNDATPNPTPESLGIAQLSAPVLLPEPLFHELGLYQANMAQDGSRDLLQLKLTAMAHDKKVLAALAANNPRIRNNLLVLLAEQSFDKLRTAAGKEQLRQALLDEINRILAIAEAPGAAQAIYFTDFRMERM